jgi:hypothetical protein
MNSVRHCRNCTCELDDSIRFRFCSESCQREFEADEAEHRRELMMDSRAEREIGEGE